jgi:hypothetical protein
MVSAVDASSMAMTAPVMAVTDMRIDVDDDDVDDDDDDDAMPARAGRADATGIAEVRGRDSACEGKDSCSVDK